MLQYLWLIPLGFVTGTYATLVGLGGGFIMVPILLMVYPDVTPEIVTSISLAVVFVNGISGTWAYARMQRIDYRSGIIFAIATVPGAIVGAMTTAFIPRRLFELIFGILMIGLSAFLIKNPQRKKKKAENQPESANTVETSDGTTFAIPSYNPLPGIGISIFVGFLSSLLGIGGGIILVPLMIYVLHFPVHVATATSLFILAISSFAGTMTHVATGVLSEGIWQVVFLSTGVIFGAQLGAFLSSRLQSSWIIRALALALGVTGIKFVFSGVFG